MSKTSSSDLTGDGETIAEQIAKLDRESWEELEEQLWLRCPLKCRFDVHYYGIEHRPWEWLIKRCHTWEEVERVLNWYKVDWERDGLRKIVLEGMLIFRCR